VASRLSNLQYTTLRYFYTHEVTTEHIGLFNMTIVRSLALRELIARNGNIIKVTDTGLEILESFKSAVPTYRLHEGPPSDTVRRLLHLRGLELSA